MSDMIFTINKTLNLNFEVTKLKTCKTNYLLNFFVGRKKINNFKL